MKFLKSDFPSDVDLDGAGRFCLNSLDCFVPDYLYFRCGIFDCWDDGILFLFILLYPLNKYKKMRKINKNRLAFYQPAFQFGYSGTADYASIAFLTTIEKACGSRIAKSASILRLIVISALCIPWIKRL